MKHAKLFIFSLKLNPYINLGSVLITIIVLIMGSCSGSGKKDASAIGNEFWSHRFISINDVPYGETEEQIMDFYCQGQWIGEPNYWKFDSVKHPTLIYFHGGGWLSNNKRQSMPFIIPYMQKGWNVVSVEYRKGENTAPLAVLDCVDAISWITSHADEYGVDTGMMVLSGESAGGHLALISGILTNLQQNGPAAGKSKANIKAVINWYGISDIRNIYSYLSNDKPDWNYAIKWMGTEARLDSLAPIYSPMQRLTPSAPAILSVHGTSDSVVPHLQSVDLHKRLDEIGIRNKLVLVEGARHLGFTDEQFQFAFGEIFKFLAEEKK